MFLLAVFPILMGAGLGMQIAVSSKLQRFTGSPYISSLVSFIVGTIFLGCLTVLSGQGLLVSHSILSDNPWWLWTGGALGVFFLTANILLFPRLGGVQTAVLPIFGQIIMGILIDQFGLLHSPTIKLTLTRGLGLLLVFAGVLVTIEVISNKQKLVVVGHKKQNHLPWQILGVVSGMFSATQAAVNGRLGVVLDSSIHAATISFFIGVIILFVLTFVTRAPLRNLSVAFASGKKYWWIWIGGLLGGIYVFGSAFLVPKIGTGQVVVLALFGQLFFSAVIDHLGMFESQKHVIHRQKIIGLVILFIGVAMINFL